MTHGSCKERQESHPILTPRKVFNAQFGSIVYALEYLPDETVIDGEIVAVDAEGRPDFNLLQNLRSARSNVI
jgi:hypothetical protein